MRTTDLKWKSIVTAVVTILTAVSGCLLDKDPDPGSISGTVVTDLLDATARARCSSGDEASVGSNGFFHITDVDPGTHRVEIIPSKYFFTEKRTGAKIESGINRNIGSIELRDLYVDSVISSNNVTDPTNCVGFIDRSDYAILSSSDDSWIILDMGENEEIIDGSGDDLQIGMINLTGNAECWVDCSRDGSNYTRFSTSITPTSSWLDLDDISFQDARYIKITATGQGSFALQWIMAKNH